MIAVQTTFFDRLPVIETVPPDDAEVAWLLYRMDYSALQERYILTLDRTVYTTFAALDKITGSEAGDVEDFVSVLNQRIATGRYMGMPEETGVPPTVEPQPPLQGGITDILLPETDEPDEAMLDE